MSQDTPLKLFFFFHQQLNKLVMLCTVVLLAECFYLYQ